jgi:hypothetical protein
VQACSYASRPCRWSLGDVAPLSACVGGVRSIHSFFCFSPNRTVRREQRAARWSCGRALVAGLHLHSKRLRHERIRVTPGREDSSVMRRGLRWQCPALGRCHRRGSNSVISKRFFLISSRIESMAWGLKGVWRGAEPPPVPASTILLRASPRSGDCGLHQICSRASDLATKATL